MKICPMYSIQTVINQYFCIFCHLHDFCMSSRFYDVFIIKKRDDQFLQHFPLCDFCRGLFKSNTTKNYSINIMNDCQTYCPRAENIKFFWWTKTRDTDKKARQKEEFVLRKKFCKKTTNTKSIVQNWRKGMPSETERRSKNLSSTYSQLVRLAMMKFSK